MKIWIISSITSLILTIVMASLFFISFLVLNGSITYLTLNCIVWPFMVGITTAVSWLIVTLFKGEIPLWQLGLLNAAIVTSCLAILAVIFYFI